MVAYSFRPQFEDPILSGRKRQTIRSIGRRRHARSGDALQLYTGMRSPKCRLLARSICTGAQEVSLYFGDDAVWLDGVRFKGLDSFAQADGFRSWAELCAFWQANHPKEFTDGMFEGVLIRWGDLTSHV